MNDCVVQSFPERDLDGVFLAPDAVRPFDEPHQTVYQRRDSRNFTRYPSVDFEQASALAGSTQMRSPIGVPVRGFHSSHDESPLSATGQPKAKANRVKQSKSFAVVQHAIPLFPLADQTQNREHAVSPLICVAFGRCAHASLLLCTWPEYEAKRLLNLRQRWLGSFRCCCDSLLVRRVFR